MVRIEGVYRVANKIMLRFCGVESEAILAMQLRRMGYLKAEEVLPSIEAGARLRKAWW